MKLPLNQLYVPDHIDGFILRTALRDSRFSARRFGATQHEPAALHHRDELELNLTVRGRAHYLIGDRKFQVRANDMLWILPRQNRLFFDASDNYLAWVLAFRRRLVRRVCTTAFSQPLRQLGGQVPLLRRLSRPAVIALEEIYQGVPTGLNRDVFNSGLAYALTRSWLAFQDASTVAVPDRVHPAVREAAWRMRDAPPLMDNAALGRVCGLSATRLSRLFRQQMGIPLAEFRNRCRLQHFLRIYGDGADINMTSAALDAGFGSYAQFHRVFRQLMGQTPRDYARPARTES